MWVCESAGQTVVCFCNDRSSFPKFFLLVLGSKEAQRDKFLRRLSVVVGPDAATASTSRSSVVIINSCLHHGAWNRPRKVNVAFKCSAIFSEKPNRINFHFSSNELRQGVKLTAPGTGLVYSTRVFHGSARNCALRLSSGFNSVVGWSWTSSRATVTCDSDSIYQTSLSFIGPYCIKHPKKWFACLC